jgi:hypothetical protein
VVKKVWVHTLADRRGIHLLSVNTQQASSAGEPRASTEERRPEPSATTEAVEPVVSHVEEEAPAEAGLVDIASLFGAPTVTVVRSNL